VLQHADGQRTIGELRALGLDCDRASVVFSQVMEIYESLYTQFSYPRRPNAFHVNPGYRARRLDTAEDSLKSNGQFPFTFGHHQNFLKLSPGTMRSFQGHTTTSRQQLSCRAREVAVPLAIGRIVPDRVDNLFDATHWNLDNAGQLGHVPIVQSVKIRLARVVVVERRPTVLVA